MHAYRSSVFLVSYAHSSMSGMISQERDARVMLARQTGVLPPAEGEEGEEGGDESSADGTDNAAGLDSADGPEGNAGGSDGKDTSDSDGAAADEEEEDGGHSRALRKGNSKGKGQDASVGSKSGAKPTKASGQPQGRKGTAPETASRAARDSAKATGKTHKAAAAVKASSSSSKASSSKASKRPAAGGSGAAASASSAAARSGSIAASASEGDDDDITSFVDSSRQLSVNYAYNKETELPGYFTLTFNQLGTMRGWRTRGPWNDKEEERVASEDGEEGEEEK